MSKTRHSQTKTITLDVPSSYTVPTLYESNDVQTVAQILTLGAQTYTVLQQESQKQQHDTLFQALKQQAESEYTPQLKQIQTQIEQARLQNEQLKQRLQVEEDIRLNLEKRIREEERRNREELVQEKDSRIQSLENHLRTHIQGIETQMKESSRSLSDSFQTFRESMLKTNSGSKLKGDLGETIFEELAQRAFGTGPKGEFFQIENVGKEGHQGDIRMTWKTHKILIEVKNYDHNVDQKQVTKFLRDMEESQEIQMGLMVSLHTGIVGHTKAGSVDIEELRDGRICVYLSKFLTHEDPVAFLQGLKPFLEALLDIQSARASQNDADTEAMVQVSVLEQQRSILLRLVHNHQESVRKFRNTLQNAKKKHEQIWLELQTDMRETESQVKLLLETLLHQTKQEEHEDVELVTLPDHVFRYTDPVLYNERERKFVEELCNLYSFDTTSKLSKKDLKESMKVHGYSEDTVTKLCEKVLTDEAWDKGKKEVNYFVKE